MIACTVWISNVKFNLIPGEYGPAIGLFIAANTGCNPAATVAILAIGVGLNGGIYSGFKVIMFFFIFFLLHRILACHNLTPIKRKGHFAIPPDAIPWHHVQWLPHLQDVCSRFVWRIPYCRRNNSFTSNNLEMASLNKHPQYLLQLRPLFHLCLNFFQYFYTG